MKKTSAAMLAVPLAASMLLAGCGGDTKPQASSSSTASSSHATTASPTTSASRTTGGDQTIDPNIPAAARAHTPAGAEAFARYFFDRLNAAWTGPQAGILSPLCEASAVACSGFEKDATRLTKEKHRYDGNPVTIRFIGVTDTTNPDRVDLIANVVQENRSEIDKAGKVYVTDIRKALRFHFVLLYTGHIWTVSSLKLVK